MTIFTRSVFSIATLLLALPAANAQQTPPVKFGSPNAVENQVEYDFGEAWDAWKQNLKDDFGLVLNVDYATSSQVIQ